MTRLILIILVGLFALSCDKKRSHETEETRLEKANALMGKEDYDGAIALLEDLRQGKHSANASLTLASAYAARAGVKVEKYWGFLVGDQVLDPAQDVPSSDLPQLDAKLLPPGTPKEVRDGLDNLNKSLREADKIRRRVEKLPQIAYEKREDLQKAVAILNEVPTQGGHLYRGILEAILFRSAADDIGRIGSELLKSPTNLCSKKIVSLIDWLDYSAKILDQFFLDAGLAFPKKNAEFVKLREDLQKWGGVLDQVSQTVHEQGSALCAASGS